MLSRNTAIIRNALNNIVESEYILQYSEVAHRKRLKAVLIY